MDIGGVNEHDDPITCYLNVNRPVDCWLRILWFKWFKEWMLSSNRDCSCKRSIQWFMNANVYRNQWFMSANVYRNQWFINANVIIQTCYCFWWMIRDQEHRMMTIWENGYLRIGGNRRRRNIDPWIGFHWMTVEGYLLESIPKWILSRITKPIHWKLKSFPFNSVNEGRSVHSSFHSLPLFIVRVFL